MQPVRKRVAIVGGGPAGLIATKHLKEEGYEPTCFEKSDDFGGTWRYRQQDIHGMPSIMWTTTANHSKNFFLSDFLVPKKMPNYLKHDEILKYFTDYAEQVDALRHIIFHREVVNIKKTSDYEETGRWLVSVKNTIDGTVEKEIFDGVLVCVGQFSYPKMAEYPGMGEFGGKVMHSHSLKTLEKFYGQKVAVVGTGCSALDAAIGISDFAKQVYLSTRTPSWYMSRVGPYGMPLDCILLRRYIVILQKILPMRLANGIFQQLFSNSQFDHHFYGIDPKYPVLSRDPVFADGLAVKLLSGSVTLRKNIRRFSKEGIIFDGDEKVTEVDTVIMATGYTWNLDFIEEGTVNVENGRFNLYKCMYPTNLKYPTLAIIGLILPFGSGFPLAELQIRWAVHLLANNKSLPCEEIMLKDAKERHEANLKRYSPSEKISVKVDFVQYADEIATELSIMPNFLKMSFTDPRLFVACIFGMCIPAQYRLVGPNKWEGAREAILTSSERMQAPLSGERLSNKHFKINVVVDVLIPVITACLLCWMNLPLCYVTALFVACCALRKKVFSNCFLLSFLLAYLCNIYGSVVLYILAIIIFLYCNFGYYFANRWFWT